ncbi:P-loop containing nucleoside triphosphate hydrolase protein [Dactylonectria macrodidyma]|uniref:P-loop containing nucleoside triphosphate hydrolase protein n=1 Tax=Dactylonectria macrodidyma TaxID=307937 RepID=A0A9P9DSQ5_9HYPO|nr:P-loop containing nucleoside triphosphate hydrolase protein [Dactylonectria macrodidyma]
MQPVDLDCWSVLVLKEASGLEGGSPNETVSGVATNDSKRRKEDSDDESEDERPRKFRCFGEADDLQHCIIKPGRIKTTFADVHVHSSTIDALDNITLPLLQPAAFGYGILSKCRPPSVLLYGPPGTGKTLLVRALARQARSKILAISGADINDKYVGVGEKNIKNIFALARREYPCIIFIDEADALFRSRSADDRSCARSYLNEFLAEMDGIKSRNVRNPTVTHHGRPAGCYCKRGDSEIHLRGESLAADVDISELAKATANYTGSDLKNLAYSAAVTALREEMDLAQKLPGPPASNTPELTATQVGSNRVLRREHFLHTKREIPASPIAETVAKLREFHNKFGDTVQRHSAAGPVNKVKPSVAC